MLPVSSAVYGVYAFFAGSGTHDELEPVIALVESHGAYYGLVVRNAEIRPAEQIEGFLGYSISPTYPPPRVDLTYVRNLNAMAQEKEVSQ